MPILEDTEKTYGLLWTTQDSDSAPIERWHFNVMQDVIEVPIVRGRMGIEIGCGGGHDTYVMAKANPSVNFLSIDVSDGIFTTKRRVASLGNVQLIKCSALEIPVKGSLFDFAYSFGVLHHTTDPKKGLREIASVLKNGSPAFLYLYEDHSENWIKFVSLKFVSFLRAVTVRIPKKILYILSCLVSPLVFFLFTVPSRIMRKFKMTEKIASAMPFNFGTGPFSLRWDLYDRFGAPAEHRFSRKTVEDLFIVCGFYDVRITRLRDTAGWVAWGYKR